LPGVISMTPPVRKNRKPQICLDFLLLLHDRVFMASIGLGMFRGDLISEDACITLPCAAASYFKLGIFGGRLGCRRGSTPYHIRLLRSEILPSLKETGEGGRRGSTPYHHNHLRCSKLFHLPVDIARRQILEIHRHEYDFEEW
jgi:hypothetical protein